MPSDGTRSFLRFGPVSGYPCHGTSIRDLHVPNNSGGPVIAVWGDALQEQSGIRGCIFQGWRQCVKFHYGQYSTTDVDGPLGTFEYHHNANYQIMDSDFYGQADKSTTLAAPVAASATTLVLSDVDGFIFKGDYVSVELDAPGPDGDWHWACVYNVVGTTITIYPAMPGAAAADNQVKYNSPTVDVHAGGACRIIRNTIIPVTSPANWVEPLTAPCLRLAGQNISVDSLHTEMGKCAVLLGDYIDGYNTNSNPLGTPLTANINCENVDVGAHGVTGMDIVRISNRHVTALAVADRHVIRSSSFDSLFGWDCTNLLVDEGDTVQGREAFTISRATYGVGTAAVYRIGELPTGSAWGPRVFTDVQEGRINLGNSTTPMSGGLQSINANYGKFFRLYPANDNSTRIGAIEGYRFGRELFLTNISEIASFSLAHNTTPGGITDSATLLFTATGDDIVVGPRQIAWIVYGIGSLTTRWAVANLNELSIIEILPEYDSDTVFASTDDGTTQQVGGWAPGNVTLSSVPGDLKLPCWSFPGVPYDSGPITSATLTVNVTGLTTGGTWYIAGERPQATSQPWSSTNHIFGTWSGEFYAAPNISNVLSAATGLATFNVTGIVNLMLTDPDWTAGDRMNFWGASDDTAALTCTNSAAPPVTTGQARLVIVP